MSHSGWINCVLVEQIHTSRFLATNYQHAYMHPDRSHPSRSLAISYTQQLVSRVGGDFCWENNRLGRKTEKWEEKKWKEKGGLGKKRPEGWETMHLYWPPCHPLHKITIAFLSQEAWHLCPSYNASTVQSQPWQLCHSTSAISEFSPLVSNRSPSDISSPTELFLSVKTELARATQHHGISVSFQVVHTELNGVQRKTGI